MYVITYWFRDPFNGVERSGYYHATSLTDVFAFGAMVERYGGLCSCDIGKGK